MTSVQLLSIIFISVYYVIVIVFSFRILLENKNPLKTQSYLLLMTLLPVIGLVIYLLFGINFRKQKLFSRKGFRDQKIIQQWIDDYEHLLRQSSENMREFLNEKAKLPFLFWRNNFSALSSNNRVVILNNGEEKFPKLMEKIQEARHHIHVEYYILEDDEIGNKVMDLLCEKAKSGIEVRMIVDDLGSNHLRTKTIRKLRKSGIQFNVYNPVIFSRLANRVNYRDHRKIVVIDGEIGFIGGINIADRYINGPDSSHYWRDTHCMIEGEATYSLQILFLLNWYFVSKELIHPAKAYFPSIAHHGDVVSSIISSDPDSDFPNLMES